MPWSNRGRSAMNTSRKEESYRDTTGLMASIRNQETEFPLLWTDLDLDLD